MFSMPENIKKQDIALTSLLNPVKKELSALERKMAENLSGNNKLLNEISSYIIAAGGKKLRPAICFLLAKALNNGFVSSNHFHLGLGLELIHNATLIHDDIIDESDKRHGINTINYKWDNKTAVLTGDFFLAKALMNLTCVKNNSIMEIFANIIGEMCEGEIQQGLQKFQIISMEEYIDKSRKKTANLFIAGAESAAILTPGVDNTIINAIREYALNFGIAFQIMDDVLNFIPDKKNPEKPDNIDLYNGILTAPVLFAIKEYDKKGDNSLERLIQTNFKNKKDFDNALNLILESNGIEESKKLAKYYSEKAIKSLNSINESPYKLALLALACYITAKPPSEQKI